MATNGSSNSSSAQLERQADATRAQVAETLDRLRSRMSPGQMVDQAIEYARDNGAADFVRNLGQQVKASPLPVALIGTGIAWLMLSNGQSAARTSAGGNGAARTRPGEGIGSAGKGVSASAAGVWNEAAGAVRDASQQVSETSASLGDTATAAGRKQWQSARSAFGDVASSVGDTGAGVGESVRDAASSVAQAAGAVRDTVAGAAGDIGTTFADAGASAAGAAKDAAGSLRDSAASLGAGIPGQQAVMGFAREQPLVLGALGLALGALLGAVLPSTRTEDELVGASSDALKEEAKHTAEEQLELAVDVGERAFNAGAKEAEAQGLSLDSASDLAGSVGEKVAAVAGAATEAAAERTGGAAAP